MATDHRPTPDALALLSALEREPWRFGFLQTLRALECQHAERPRLGETVRAADDMVRLGQEPSLIFAPAELAALRRSGTGRAPRLLVYFLGLLGPNGPLPLHLTDYARDRLRNAGDATFARFLDLFNHRMLSLFYRAWAQAQPAVSFDRPGKDRFGTYLGSLHGIGMPGYRHRDAMPDLFKLHHSGHLSCQARHAEGLGAILSDYLKLPVRIEEFIGHWLQLPQDCRWRLGESPEAGCLGLTTTIGGRVWDHQSKFRIRVGPLRLSDYLRLLPGGKSLSAVKAIVRNYVGQPLDWDLNPVLARPEVPAIRLGKAGCLGWTTWLTSRPLARDGDDLKLDPNVRPVRAHRVQPGPEGAAPNGEPAP
ncbi:type VI secretion system baseplate subunit TssG [Thiohalocapsa marina]|uniref:Type VI secretion system baseplate subunit TssG n=1 Tax=Thiohalocapsa marina TaxID=424902 RepID=A0A5M8FU70_9GAMM|nr:type VI secretion system baseplate subunit TssG [Thiohalocapsa marina]KAA6187368.1 type VI secretion system baseplate subunit TssG [Thiohalocapsa marina]